MMPIAECGVRIEFGYIQAALLSEGLGWPLTRLLMRGTRRFCTPSPGWLRESRFAAPFDCSFSKCTAHAAALADGDALVDGIDVHSPGVIRFDPFADVSHQRHQAATPDGARTNRLDVDSARRDMRFAGCSLEPSLEFLAELRLQVLRDVHYPVDMTTPSGRFYRPDEHRPTTGPLSCEPADEMPTANLFKHMAGAVHCD